MDKYLDCDFVFGDTCDDIKQMDYSLLNSKVINVKNIKIGPFVWQQGVIRQLYQPYKNYILLGQLNILSMWIFMLLAKFTHKKIFLWTHGWYGRESTVKKNIKKLFFSLADGMLIYGDYAINLMKKEGFKASKLFAIHNSLDYDKQITIRNNIMPTSVYTDHFGNDNHNLIFIGRLTKIKQLDMILEALKQSNQAGINYNLTYIGRGEDEDQLRNIAKELGIEKQVWFYGACYAEEELSQLIYSADLCVAPGNVGLTSIHCLTYGCPVVTHNNFPMQMPEFEAIKEGETGAFFTYNNQDSLTETINKWFSLSLNREDVRAAAYKEIDERWNPHYQIEIIKNLLETK
ncbi:MAG: glycosyltransferase [Rikenellaceae bacterium]